MRTFLGVMAGGLAGVAGIVLLQTAGAFPFLEAAWRDLLFRSGTLDLDLGPNNALLLAAALAFVFAFLALEVAPAGRRWLIAGLAVALVLSASWVLSLYGVMLFPAPPVTAILLGLVSASVLARVGPAAFRRKVDQVFGGSLGRAELRRLYDAPATVLAPAADRTVSVICLETANHAQLMESMQAGDFAEMCHAYLSSAAEFLIESGGYLDSFSGQELRVAFGLPLERENHATDACRAAIELGRRLERMHVEAESRWHHILEFQIGVATGAAAGGVFETRRGRCYVVAGPALDLASRLAFACREYGCRILICMQTHRAAGELFEVRPMDLVAGGDVGEIEIYELLAPKGSLSPERKRSRDRFWAGIGHFRARRWDAAVGEFAQARIKGIPDPPLDFYLQRIERERKQSGPQGPAAG